MRNILLRLTAIAAFALALYFIIDISFSEKKFDDVLAEQGIGDSKINAIKIIDGSTKEEKYIIDRKEIQSIMKNFTGLKMKKNNLVKLPDERSYFLSISSANSQLTLIIDNRDYLKIYGTPDKDFNADTYKLSEQGTALFLQDVFN